MRVAILSSASGGGAGIAAYRIYEAIKKYQSSKCEVVFIDMSVLGGVSEQISPTVNASNELISNTHYTADFASEVRAHIITYLQEYDVINIQWSSYLLTIAEIYELAKIGKCIVFTMHDFYYFTGGCHYPSTCKQYLLSCSLCPQVNIDVISQKDIEEAHKLKRKIFLFDNVILTAPSEYIVNKAIEADFVPKSRGYTIRNAYEPIEGKEGKSHIEEKIHILIIADSFYETRKQLQLAIDGFKVLAGMNPERVDDFVIHLVGKLDDEVLEQLRPHGYVVINHGHKSNHEDIVDVYCQVDYLLTPSLDDNWPNVLVESSAYGVMPIVGPGHGCEEFVKKFGGELFDSYTAQSLAGVLALILDKPLSNILSTESKYTHNSKRVSSQYLEVFLDNTARY